MIIINNDNNNDDDDDDDDNDNNNDNDNNYNNYNDNNDDDDDESQSITCDIKMNRDMPWIGVSYIDMENMLFGDWYFYRKYFILTSINFIPYPEQPLRYFIYSLVWS